MLVWGHSWNPFGEHTVGGNTKGEKKNRQTGACSSSRLSPSRLRCARRNVSKNEHYYLCKALICHNWTSNQTGGSDISKDFCSAHCFMIRRKQCYDAGQDKKHTDIVRVLLLVMSCVVKLSWSVNQFKKCQSANSNTWFEDFGKDVEFIRLELCKRILIDKLILNQSRAFNRDLYL